MGQNIEIHQKSLGFFTDSKHFGWFFSEINPLRIAQKWATDLVVKNKRKIPPEKCEKFWQKIRRRPTFLGIGNTQTTEIAL